MNEVDVAATGLAAGVGIYWLISIIFYVYFAFGLQTIAKKTNADDVWFAWIPILNLILFLNIAEKPLWWIAFTLPTPASPVMAIIALAALLKKRNYPAWWWLLFVLLAPIGFIFWGLVAWKDRDEEVPVAAE